MHFSSYRLRASLTQRMVRVIVTRNKGDLSWSGVKAQGQEDAPERGEDVAPVLRDICSMPPAPGVPAQADGGAV
jgi:hypothetical protein